MHLGHRMYFILCNEIYFIYLIEILSGTNLVAAIVHITEYQTITKNNAVEWAMSTSEWTIANKRENGLCGTVALSLVHCKSKFLQWPCPCPCKPMHAPSLPPSDGHFSQWPCPGCPCEPACTPSLLPSDGQFLQWPCPCPCKPTHVPSLPPLGGPCTAVCFFEWPHMPPLRCQICPWGMLNTRVKNGF